MNTHEITQEIAQESAIAQLKAAFEACKAAGIAFGAHGDDGNCYEVDGLDVVETTEGGTVVSFAYDDGCAYEIDKEPCL